jgi:hypothetical protein
MRNSLGGHARPIGLAISARFNPVIAAARPPTRTNRASARHHEERIHCLGRRSQAARSDAIPGTASGRHCSGNGIAGKALGRCRGPRIRLPSCLTALKRNALGRHHGERLRTPSRPAGLRVHPAWCRPTSACSPTPFRRARSCRFSVVS